MNLLSIGSAKLSAFMAQKLKLGSGSALPGRVALQLSPKLIREFNKQTQASDNTYMITGTNGKTTSTGILKNISRLNNIKLGRNPYIICNDRGANLYYGICSELVHSSTMTGKLKSSDFCLELDEASLKKLTQDLTTKNILVTNIFRDQLDRFGELDSTLNLILEGINQNLKSLAASQAKGKVNISINADDERLCGLGAMIDKNFDYEVFYYGVVDENGQRPKIDDIDASDTELMNKELDFTCKIIEQNIESSRVEFLTKNDKIEVEIKLPGLYNIYNASSAAAAAFNNGISLELIKEGIESFVTNFGRSETKVLNAKEYKVFLIKNPTGASEVLRHLTNDKNAKFLIAINDNYADGRDVSWLWDAKFDYLAENQKTFLCSGRRANDMALRLKYAGIKTEQIQVQKDLSKALQDFTKSASDDESLYVLPSYTCLLALS